MVGLTDNDDSSTIRLNVKMKTFYKIPSQWGSTFAQIYLSSSQSLLSSVHLSIDVIFRDTSSRIISISVLQATKVLTSVKEPGELKL